MEDNVTLSIYGPRDCMFDLVDMCTEILQELWFF